MDNLQRKKDGLPYHYDDPKLMGQQTEYEDLLYDFNHSKPSEKEQRDTLMHQMFASCGKETHVEAPVYSTWGCHHTHLGNGVYCNSGVTFLDDADIFIGDYTMIAPNVVISTAGHPVLPILREHHYVYNLPVHIGRNVWIGSGAQILPGVTIGDNTVIGAGAVVTHNIPANVVAYGVPCAVVREINEKDRNYFYKDRRLDVEE